MRFRLKVELSVCKRSHVQREKLTLPPLPRVAAHHLCLSHVVTRMCVIFLLFRFFQVPDNFVERRLQAERQTL